MLHKVSWLFVFVLLLGLAGCSPAETEPGAAPTDVAAEQVATEALPAARQALADYLGVDPETPNLDTIEDTEWSDACLGLGGAADSCAAVITPGYTINFTVGDAHYTVRTDLEGTQVRLEGVVGEVPVGNEQPPAVEFARGALASQLGIDLAAVELIDFEQRDWSDSCLGLGGAAESCAAVITPGWKVTLQAEGNQYEVRTDLEGEHVRIANRSASEPAGEVPAPDLDGAAVFFQRSGGLAGELLTVRIYSNGVIERTLGKLGADAEVETVGVDPAIVTSLITDLEEAGYFDLARTYLPEDTCCDRFLYLMSVQGGESIHTVEALEAIEEAPDTLWQSVMLIETVMEEAVNR